MDHGRGFKNRGTYVSEASGPQKLDKLHLGGNLKFFGYGIKGQRLYVILLCAISRGQNY